MSMPHQQVKVFQDFEKGTPEQACNAFLKEIKENVINVSSNYSQNHNGFVFSVTYMIF